MKFRELPKFIAEGTYRVNIGWNYIEEWIERENKLNLNLDPDFQRAHVWTEAQQQAYVEFVLKGGRGSGELKFNCAGWMIDFRGPFVLVDGKQRLEAVRKFLRNELTIFENYKYSDFEDRLPVYAEFIVMVNDLADYDDVLRWYLQLNSCGTPHTEDELEKVRQLLEN